MHTQHDIYDNKEQIIIRGGFNIAASPKHENIEDKEHQSARMNNKDGRIIKGKLPMPPNNTSLSG
jgi:hypothetical protein